MRTRIVLMAACLLSLLCFGALVAEPQAKPDPLSAPLLGHLLTPSAEWLTAYGAEPYERSAVVYSLRAVLRNSVRLQQEIDTLKARVTELERRLAPEPNEATD